jgi:hypothetical protein
MFRPQQPTSLRYFRVRRTGRELRNIQGLQVIFLAETTRFCDPKRSCRAWHGLAQNARNLPDCSAARYRLVPRLWDRPLYTSLLTFLVLLPQGLAPPPLDVPRLDRGIQERPKQRPMPAF